MRCLGNVFACLGNVLKNFEMLRCSFCLPGVSLCYESDQMTITNGDVGFLNMPPTHNNPDDSTNHVLQKNRILVVEDDAEMRELVADYLVQAQFEVRTAADATSFYPLLRSWPADLVVLDLMLPGQDGLSICRHLRNTPQWQHLAVIMLTARSSAIDRVVGLELGADDYLGKPFEPVELLARIKAVLRRSRPFESHNPHAQSADALSSAYVLFEGWKLDTTTRQIIAPNGLVISLPSSDFRILKCLLGKPHRPVSRDELLAEAFGRDRVATDRSVDVCISRLRGHLEKDSKTPKIIRTVRHEGYVYSGSLPEYGA